MADKRSVFLGVLFFLYISFVGAYGISIFENIPLVDSIYMTYLMLTTVDMMFEPTTTLGKIIVVSVLYMGMGAVLYTATTVASIIIEGKTSMLLRGIRGGFMRMKKEKDHVIICGYGMTGRYTLESMGEDAKRYVIIEKDPEIAKMLLEKEMMVIQGNALDQHILEKANIKNAKTIVCCLKEDSDNIYLVMTATDMNPNVVAAAKANDEEAVPRLHKVGAHIVVMPEIVGGKQLAKAIQEMDKDEELSSISKKDDPKH